MDAEDRPKIGPRAWQDGLNEVERERYNAWAARSEAARPPDVPARTPFIETGGALRWGLISECNCGYLGSEVTLGYRASTWFALELPVAFLHGIKNGTPSWSMLSVRPAYAATWFMKGSFLYGRIGPDLLVPVDTGQVLPDALVGGFMSMGGVFYLTEVANAGYAAFTFDFAAAIRGPIESHGGPLDKVRLGGDFALGFKVAF